MRAQVYVLGFALGCLILSGCAAPLPVHETRTPEVLGPWGFDVGVVAGSAPIVATDTNSTDSDVITLPVAGYRAGIGLGSRLQLDADVLMGASSATVNASLSLKYQLLGDHMFKAKAGNTSLSFILGTVSGAAVDIDPTSPSYTDSDITLNATQLGVVYGHRWYDSFGGYVGGKLFSGKANVDYRNVEGGPVVLQESRSFSSYGVNTGIFYNPRGKYVGLSLVGELSLFNAPRAYKSGNAWSDPLVSFNMSMPFSFAGR